MGTLIPHTKFQPPETVRLFPNCTWNFGLTEVEVGTLRSLNCVNRGIYELSLTFWFQNRQKCRNRTKIDKLLLHKLELWNPKYHHNDHNIANKSFAILVHSAFCGNLPILELGERGLLFDRIRILSRFDDLIISASDISSLTDIYNLDEKSFVRIN